MLPDKVYNVLKWIALVFLNAFGKLYENLATTWDLPYGKQIADTCVYVSIFLGTCIGVSGLVYQFRKRVDPLEKNDSSDLEFIDIEK